MRTEHYRPGAVGGPALGYELNLNTLRDGPQPTAGPPKAPGRSCSVAFAVASCVVRRQSLLSLPPARPRLHNMTGNWFIATYYFGSFGYSRWRPGSRVR